MIKCVLTFKLLTLSIVFDAFLQIVKVNYVLSFPDF